MNKKTYLILSTVCEYPTTHKVIMGKPIQFGHDGVGIMGESASVRLVMLQMGIGKVNAAYAATIGIKEYNPHHVICAGVAGGLKNTKVGDLVMANSLTYFDADATGFDYKLGQIPQMPDHYNALVPTGITLPKRKIYEGQIVSGDSFINNTKIVKTIEKSFPTAYALDMESAAIAQICYLSRVPYTCLRTISDNATDSSNTDFDTNLAIANEQLSIALERTLKSLSK